ncbi:unnamed protein product [Durusdinium trenchii]|uniref:Uncharacterized protein n=1 Tax=Durusdinium trenchii TaxID=1381693 RepID=A0ABP0KCX8_9DINO
MSRAAGTLFAIPVGFFPEEVLSGGSEAASGDFVGPSTAVTVPLVFEEEDGTESQTGLEAEVLLVDLHKMVMDFVRGFDPVTEGPGIQAFSIDNPDLVPDGNSLMKEVYSWLESATEGRAQYYSAEEPPPQAVIPKQSRQKNRAPFGGGSPPKRVTTATLAEQLAELSKSIHATSSQLETMAQRQDRMENLLASPAAPAQLPVPAHQRPFQTALSTLVAHLVNQDGLADFPGTGSSSAISLKGSAKRDKLMMDLAMRKGDFFLKVSQNAFRRLKPTEKMPRTLEEFAGRPIFAKYAERSGGFSGQRDFGLMMWLLCQIGDAMLNGDNKGAQELLALTMVTIEQAAQDNGKWEVAWILSLQEDPPPGLFMARPASTNPRLRAFSPLCPPEWAATALSFVKEVDIISTRRQEALPSKKTQKQGEETDNPKKKPQRRCGSRQRRRLMVDRAFHVCIMALNFWHADFKHIPVESIAKEPSPAQAQALVNLKRMLRAFGSSSEEFSVPKSGRRLTSLIALLSDLSEFATWRGIGGSAYSRSFPGASDINKKETYVPRNLSRAEELRPYRALDPDRLVLSGKASWDPDRFLSDMLWMAFQEPNSLLWTASERSSLVPDLAKESYESVKDLALLWDINGLLHLEEAREEDDPTLAMRFFNCYKNETTDRMIGDRRSRNYVEGRLAGVSSGLPSAQCLFDLEVELPVQRISICASDRKDFYHQHGVPASRAKTNRLYPPLRISDLKGTKAFQAWALKRLGGNRYDRALEGDFLAFGGKKLKKAVEGGLVNACLLTAESELRADCPFYGSNLATGLVIDDYYAVSVEESSCPKWDPSQAWTGGSQAAQLLQKATAAYEKVARENGVVTVGAPVHKRLALAYVSLTLAKMRYTTDALHACLVGGWVNAVLYRRPAMSLLQEVYKIPLSEVSQDSPKVTRLSRGMAQELIMLSVLCPFFATDISTHIQERCYATDSSDAKGAVVSCEVPLNVARAMVRTGRKKTTYTRMLARHEAVLKKIDADFEETYVSSEEFAEDSFIAPDRPRAFRFHFIEVCGGSGKVTKYVDELGWVVGPVLDLDRSPAYDFSALRLLQWIYFMLEDGRSLALLQLAADLNTPGTFIDEETGLQELLALSKTNGLRRFAANWLRLVLLLIGGIPPWFGSSESWRYGHVAYKHFPFGSTRPIHPQIMDFDSSMGYPGEGPPVIPQCLAARAAGRGDLELPQGRPVLPETQKQRDKLLGYFSDWLRGHGFELEEILMTATPDLETLNTLVERYGRELYRSGRPYGHYSETLNAISGKRPRVRRHLQPAWDLAYAWLRQEPPVHHLALPWQALLALITTSWTWGWSKVTGVIALSWGGITRIGEVLSACRRDLILPADVEWSINYALLQIAEPKTRYRSARHQIARLDQPQLLKVIEVAFGGLLPEQRLWPASGQTMRHRFQKLLQANRLDTLPEGISRGIDLGSLRAGGASWLLMSSENSELTRRRGRWITSKVMEVYVEEAWSVQFLPRLPSEVKKLIWNGAQIFPWALDLVVAWHGAKIPESAWPCLFLQASKDFELNHLGEKKLGGEAAAAAVCAAPKEP